MAMLENVVGTPFWSSGGRASVGTLVD